MIAGIRCGKEESQMIYVLDRRTRGACVSIVAVPMWDIICAKNWPPEVGVLGAVMGFGIALRKVRVIVISGEFLGLVTAVSIKGKVY